jgi:hypothetical protein
LLEIREQPRLSLKRQVEICVDGIHHRLLRSALTLAVVSLAVAFLANVMVEVAVVDGLRSWSSRVEAQATAVDRLLDFLTGPADSADHIVRLAGSQDGDPVDDLLRSAAAMSQEQWRSIKRQARQVDEVRHWLETLSPGPRRMLVGARGLDEAMVWLEDPGAVAQVRAAARAMPHLRPGPGVWSGLGDLRERRRALGEAVQRLNDWLAAWRRDEQAMLATANLRGSPAAPGLGESWLDALRRHEVDLAGPWVDEVLGRARQRRQVASLMAVVRDSQLRDQMGEAPDAGAAVVLARFASSDQWAGRASDRIDAAVGLDVLQIRRLAGQVVQIQRASEIAAGIAAQYGTQGGFRGSAFWLVLVSMLVCVVGVTNAMLISVLERFREIATMKCLGGLDRFIASLFLMEAAMLGTLGGLIGGLLGLAVGLGRMAWTFGREALMDLPWSALTGAVASAAVAGMVLTALSAVYPAVRAAMLPPMEAMRVG